MASLIRKVLSAAAVCGCVAAVAAPAVAAEADPKLQQVVSVDEGNGSGPVDFRRGHFDLGPRLVDGKFVFQGRDDSGEKPLWRSLDDVVFVLGDEAIQDVPAGAEYEFTGAAGKKVWTVPQTEIPGVPWLGWNTQHPAIVNGVNGNISLTFEGHEGPGKFTAFLQAGNFGAPQLLWDSTVPTAQKVAVDLNTHTHANWVFTEPGVHLVRVAAAGMIDGQNVSDSIVVRFAIGPQADPQAARAATWQRGAAGPVQADGTTAAVGQRSDRSLIIWVGAGVIAIALPAVAVLFALSLRQKRNREQARRDATRNGS